MADGDDSVELTLRFEPPVTAEDFRDRFQDLAGRMDRVIEERDEHQR